LYRGAAPLYKVSPRVYSFIATLYIESVRMRGRTVGMYSFIVTLYIGACGCRTRTTRIPPLPQCDVGGIEALRGDRNA